MILTILDFRFTFGRMQQSALYLGCVVVIGGQAFNKGFKSILQFSKLGFNVHLGSLGYVKTTVRSKGMDTSEEVTATVVSDIVPHFVFSDEFRSELKKERLEKQS
jgi:hypothetical protein